MRRQTKLTVKLSLHPEREATCATRREKPHLCTDEALAQMGRIYFVKSLTKTAVQPQRSGDSTLLTLPAQFVRDHCGKIEEWVVLRVASSCGRSSRPWIVKLSVTERAIVRIACGWQCFVAGNRLKEGDLLVFVLKEDARSEFEVHVFRRSQGAPRFPHERGDSSAGEEEEYVSDAEEDNCNLPRGHHQKERNKACIGEKHRTFPGFRKRLAPSSTRRPKDIGAGYRHAQFEFPWSFVRIHGEQVQTYVKLQGIHEDSPIHSIKCLRSPGNAVRVRFPSYQWGRFAEENRLRPGQELQFSLISESYFRVREVQGTVFGTLLRHRQQLETSS